MVRNALLLLSLMVVSYLIVMQGPPMTENNWETFGSWYGKAITGEYMAPPFAKRVLPVHLARALVPVAGDPVSAGLIVIWLGTVLSGVAMYLLLGHLFTTIGVRVFGVALLLFWRVLAQECASVFAVADMLSLGFVILSVERCFAGGGDETWFSSERLLSASIFAMMAVLCKESGVMVVPFLLAIWWKKREWSELLFISLPVAALLILRYGVPADPATTAGAHNFGLWESFRWTMGYKRGLWFTWPFFWSPLMILGPLAVVGAFRLSREMWLLFLFPVAFLFLADQVGRVVGLTAPALIPAATLGLWHITRNLKMPTAWLVFGGVLMMHIIDPRSWVVSVLVVALALATRGTDERL